MPLINLTVPRDMNPQKFQDVEERLKASAKLHGAENNVEIWPTILAVPKKRLYLEYKSRQIVADPHGLARHMAEIVASVFGLEAEVAVIRMDPETTGLHIASPRKRK